MHYYKRNIGDYAKKAGRLTMLQHGAYTLLIDACYDREVFPTLEQALEWTWASSEAEAEAVKFVLSRFFSLDKEGQYIQHRVLEELLIYHTNADTNKRIAIEREAKRREKNTNRVHIVDEPTPNHKPLTINQEPVVKQNRGSRLQADFCLTEDWKQFCRTERSDLDPQKVFDGFKDYWIAKPGQQGVKLDWLATWRNWVRNQKQGLVNKADQVFTTVPSRFERDPALIDVENKLKQAVPMPPEIRAAIERLRK